MQNEYQSHIYRPAPSQEFDLLAENDNHDIPTHDEIAEAMERMEQMLEDMHTIMLMGKPAYVR